MTNGSFQSGVVLDNRYRLDEVISQGHMGDVWKAFDEQEKRWVALKFIPTDIQQFRNEMHRIKKAYSMAHTLDHPSICPVYDMPQNDRVGYYLVMKFMTGKLLNHYLMEKGGRIEPAITIQILRPLADALDYAHQHKIVHRDIRPSCVSIDLKSNGEIENTSLIDFALAAEIWEFSTRLSQTQYSSSSMPSYMPPEQWQCHRQNAQTDQYSLAVIAYELLSGRLPFTAPNIDTLRQKVLKDSPAPIDDLPRYVNRALRRGLAKNMKKRFPSCLAFVSALEKPTGFLSFFRR